MTTTSNLRVYYHYYTTVLIKVFEKKHWNRDSVSIKILIENIAALHSFGGICFNSMLKVNLTHHPAFFFTFTCPTFPHPPSSTLTHPHPPLTHPHPPSPTLTHPHPPSPTLTHPHPPSPTLTHPHPPSPTLTHPHPPSPTLTHPHPPSPTLTHPHPPSPTLTHPHPPSPTLTHPHPPPLHPHPPYPPSPTLTHPHPPSPTLTHPHPPSPNLTHPHPASPTFTYPPHHFDVMCVLNHIYYDMLNSPSRVPVELNKSRKLSPIQSSCHDNNSANRKP